MQSFVSFIIVPLISALIGGALTLLAAWLTLRQQSRGLESEEIRKQKVQCLVSMAGLRFVMSSDRLAAVEYQAKLTFELNKLPILWAGEAEAMNDIRDCLASMTDERFVKMFRSLGLSTKLHVDKLADTDLTRLFLIGEKLK